MEPSPAHFNGFRPIHDECVQMLAKMDERDYETSKPLIKLLSAENSLKPSFSPARANVAVSNSSGR